MSVGKSLWADKSISAWTTKVWEERGYTIESMDLPELWIFMAVEVDGWCSCICQILSGREF